MCSGLSDGDTILIEATLSLNSTYDLYSTTNITVIVDNDSIVWNGNFKLNLGEGGSLILRNGAKLVNGTGSCNATKFVSFGTIDLASCNGGGAGFSFDEINAAGGIDTSGTLPVSLLEYTHQVQSKNETTLNWSTASELNNLHFIINRSVDGVRFEPIAIIPGSGTSNATLHYTYTDHFQIGEGLYYQLIQEDYDGTKELLGVIRVQLETDDILISLMPNPVHNTLNLEGEAIKLAESSEVRITNNMGTVLIRQDIIADQAANINIEKLQKGTYFLHFDNKVYRFVKM